MDDYARLMMSEKDSRIDEQAEEIADFRHEVEQLRSQLAECRKDAPKHLRAENQRLRNAVQLFEEQLSRTEDERDTYAADLARVSAERDKLREQLREAAFMPRR